MKLPAVLMLVAATALAPSAHAAEPDAAALRACRAVADAARRLACYDALVAESPPAAPAVASQQAAAPPATAPVAAAAAPARQPPADFGLQTPRAAEIQEITSRIVGLFEGWGANTRFTLANGQVWQVSDGTSASYYLKDPKVTIARAALGSFRLEIEGANQSPRVRRVE